ncbi:kinase-like domain-containing protein [Rhizophagus clarus]|uniref:Kinase-like domain-containing protein n=1 Tax=Rhizophagus clarus TaxID=94130 RepID=A0A8H3L5N2_9GLOM|nr:kinase-like domain-containing protein [Rhizophagus clarus]
MVVILKNLNNTNNFILKYIDKIKKNCEFYGITQDPQTKNYMMVLSNECKKCNCICNAIHFQQNFENWTSNNVDIDEFIQDTQLLTHKSYEIFNALEWIPYDRFNNIKHFELLGTYKANWIDGNINYWNYGIQHWERFNENMNVTLKNLNNLKNIAIEYMNKIKLGYEVYGITNFPRKSYMFVLNDLNNKYKNSYNICNAIYFQQNFKSWTSEIGMYRASWIDGCINKWNSEDQNWNRVNQNMLITLESLNNPKDVKLINWKRLYGITQNSLTKNYMMVLNSNCEKCNFVCNTVYFQQNFESWTSGNDNIDKFIQDTQLSAHNTISDALEWIPHINFNNLKYIEKIGIYRAVWINGCIDKWNSKNQNWERYQNTSINLKLLNNLKNIVSEFINEVNRPYGITQDPQTENYMMVLSDKCKKCNDACNNAQLSAHKNAKVMIEWIPYNRFCNIKYNRRIGVYKANWIDGNILYWEIEDQSWIRCNQNISVILKELNDLKNITLEFTNEINKPYGITQDLQTKKYMMVLSTNECKKFDWNNESQYFKRDNQNMLVTLKILNDPKVITNEIKKGYEFYGATQDLQTKSYMMVFNIKCKKCNCICNAIHFQENFESWTSDNDDIDKFIQDTQLLAHDNYYENVLEWIPYNRFSNINYNVEREIFKANWIDGYISEWNKDDQNWKRDNQNILVVFKILNDTKNIKSEFTNEINRLYGITQDPQTKRYIMVLSDTCKKCNYICNAIHFQQNFGSWTSYNDDIDKFIQNTQLLSHKSYEIFNALEWIPYDRFNNINYSIEKKIYKANWVEGYINEWNKYDQNWKRNNQNMLVILKIFNEPKNIILEFTNEINRLFEYIEYVAKGGFGRVYKASWLDGYIKNWNDKDQDWVRDGQNMFVALKSLNNSKNITLKFMNEITLHYRERIGNSNIIGFYGITQDPKTENYMMVLNYAKNGSLRKFLDTSYNKLSWVDKIGYLYDIAKGLESIHNNDLIHRDLHTGNILHNGCLYIADMGLCKPADHNLSVNTGNNIYGILPYIAPEILRGQDYTKDSDVYSFGIVMYEVISGLPPYHDISHDENLAIKICHGLRPIFKIKIPHLIIHLIKRCIDTDPLNRPTAKEIANILDQWKYELFVCGTELQKQIEEADRINNNSSNTGVPLTNLRTSYYKTHSEAIYTSRLLNFKNLPEPKNSDDFYEQNDNIISAESSVSLSLQIDVSELSINGNNLPESKNSNDYYEQSDNIISIESSASLSISQSNINDDDFPEPKTKNSDYYEKNNDIESLQIDISQLNISEDENCNNK